VIFHHGSQTLCSKRHLSRNQFIGKATQSILIAPGIANTCKLLWSQITEGMLFCHLITNSIFPVHKREVCQHSLAISIEENILRFNIAMKNIVCMRINESLSHL
jgi:hypothetical protein